MRQSRWFFHPILIFASSVAAVALSLTLYIYWYVEVRTGLENITEKAHLDSDQVLTSQTWMVVLVLSVLVGIIEHFYKKTRHLFKGCEIHLLNPSGETFFYPVNHTLFEILLMNLFTNAFKYNESDAPSLKVVFQTKGRKLHIRFEDNGIGLAKSEFQKVFKKFYQIGRAENMTAKGTGLGLYLVESIARFHKGKMIVESRGSGKGSVFTLVLPLKPFKSRMKREHP